ncbi:hypothetical protein J3R83DRAFT_915 [Lanmaoa asiatica]|nr:hypothetical protein J3R83DRAFT_915 [Lanmaoa asiatica]
MRLISFLFVLFSFASAFHSDRHHQLRRLAADNSSAMSTPSLSSPTLSFLPSLPISSLPIPLSPSSSPYPPSAPVQSTTFTSSSTPSPDPSTPSSASSPPSSVAHPSSSATPSAATASTSVVTSTSSASSAPVAVAQSQPSSSSTPINLFTDAGAPTPYTSSSVIFLTSGPVTPSSTVTQSSSSGFFSNTGAVAGTFTVVGLVTIAGVIAVALLIARRRNPRSYEQDTEFLDKSPDLFDDPPIRQVAFTDDESTSDHVHYASSPMPLAAPPVTYYPDHAYALHPQAFSAQGYPPPGSYGYPVTYTQDYAAQHVYSPEDYDIAYPPPAPRVETNIHNPREFTGVELDPSPVPPTQTPLPNSLRPSVKSISTVPKHWASTRYSLDSFYSGTAT